MISHVNWTANGNVFPCRFVAPVQTSVGAFLAVQASDPTIPIVGISGEETRFPPNSPADDGFIAVASEPLDVKGPGEVANLVIGATVTNAWTPLTTDSAGKGTPLVQTTDALQWVGGFAMQPAAVSDKVPVYIVSPFFQLTAHL